MARCEAGSADVWNRRSAQAAPSTERWQTGRAAPYKEGRQQFGSGRSSPPPRLQRRAGNLPKRLDWIGNLRRSCPVGRRHAPAAPSSGAIRQGVGLIGTRDAFGRVSAPERSDPDGLEIRIDFERGHGGELAAANSKVG